jgi:hypothetical protein
MANYNTGANINGPLSSVAYVGLCTTAHNNDPSGQDPSTLKYYNTVEYATYTSSYGLVARLSGPNVILSWGPAGGHLEASPALSGPGVNWQPIGSSNPATVPLAPGARFFRVIYP